MPRDRGKRADPGTTRSGSIVQRRGLSAGKRAAASARYAGRVPGSPDAVQRRAVTPEGRQPDIQVSPAAKGEHASNLDHPSSRPGHHDAFLPAFDVTGPHDDTRPDEAVTDEANEAGLGGEAALLDALPRSGLATPYEALEAASRVEAVLGGLSPAESLTAARRLEDPNDALGRRFAWFPPSARHKLRAIAHGRLGPGASAAGGTSGSATPAVQRRHDEANHDTSDGGGPPDAIHERAADGVESPGGAIPFLPTIQASFGHHDVGGIEAHVGGAAASAAADLGAAAYATGHHVAFAGPPDLHTAAHEAAHVVQQRGGVQLEGGVGQVGDPYERHADAVADRVVAGQSAEALLDEMAGDATGRTGSTSEAAGDVQRDALGPINLPKPPEPAPAGATASAWLIHFASELGPDVAGHLQGAVVPTGHPRLSWLGDEAVAARVWDEVGPTSLVGRAMFAASLRDLVAPVDLLGRVDAARPLDPDASKDGIARGPLEYVAEAAVAIARAFERAVAASAARIGPRVVAAVDAMPGAEPGSRSTSLVMAEAVVASHPIDRHVAAVLCAPATAQVAPRGDAEPLLDRAARMGPAGLRPITYRFVEDAALWNWIRVTPADASAEEVAEAVLGASSRAHELAASAPLFGLPPDVARRLAPGRARESLRSTDGVDVAGAARQAILGAGPEALAASAAADEAGLAQADRSRASAGPQAGAAGAGTASAEGPAVAGPVTLANRCHDQLDHLSGRFARFRAAALLAPARARLDARRARLDTLAPDERVRFAVLFGEQSAVLLDAAGLLQGLEADEARARQARMRPGADLAEAARPDPAVGAAAEAILSAAALSDLPELARERLAALQREREREVFDVMEAMLGDARSRSLAAGPLVPDSGPELDPRDNAALPGDLRARQRTLAAQVLAAERARARGQLAPPDLQALAERVRATQVESRLVAAIAQSRHVARRLQGEKGVVAVITGQFGDLGRAGDRLHRLANDMSGVLLRWREEHAALFASIATGTCEAGDPAARAREAIAALEVELGGLGDDEVRAALQSAHEELKDMAIARMVVDIAVMVGLTLVTSGLGTMAASGASALRMGRAVAVLADITTQSFAMAGLRASLHGDSLAGALSSELVTNFAGFAALRGLAHTLHRLPGGRALVLLGQSEDGWKYLARGAELSIEAATQAGVQYAIVQGESLLRSGRPLDDEELKRLAIHGMGMFIGNAVAHRLARPAMDRLGAFAARIGAPFRVHHVRKLAADVADGGDPVKARALLREDRILLEQELQLYQRIAADPAELRAFGPETLATIRGQAESHANALRDLTIEHNVQGRLDEIAPGEAWQGTPGSVADVLAQARAVGAPIATRVDPDGRRVHTITSGPRDFTVYERPLAPGEPEPPTPDGITGGNVRHKDFQGERMPRADRRAARHNEAAERAMTPEEQVTKLKTMTIRSEREMLEAVRRGKLPRYIARVGPLDGFNTYKTFGRPDKEFVFATEPADLRGLTPAQAMSQVGWESHTIRGYIGKKIAVVILDTHALTASPTTGKMHRQDLDGVTWKEMRKVALKDGKFLADAADAGIRSQAELEELFAIAARTPVKGTPATGDPAKAAKLDILRRLLDGQYSANPLYSGMGATVQESGQLGGREIMVRKNEGGLALTPENHKKVEIGILTQADFDAVFVPHAPPGSASTPPSGRGVASSATGGQP